MLQSDLIGMGILISYYAVAVGLLPGLLKTCTCAPFEIVRKVHHITYSLSIFLLLKLFSAWYSAVIASFVLALIIFPALALAERFPFYSRICIDRDGRGGELRRQVIYVQLSFATLILVFWGLLGAEWRYIAAVAVMAWGFGDAAAALVGKAIGRRRILHRLIEGAKTVEGTHAMAVVAGLAVFLTLLLYAGQPWYVSLAAALLVAPVCAAVELFSRRGLDTLTVPLSAGLSTLPLMLLFSQGGV